MNGLGRKAATLTFFSVSTIYQAHGSEVVQLPPKQINVTSQSVDCSPVKPISPNVSNIHTIDRSVRNANTSNSNSVSNKLTQPLANPIPTSVTVSNNCEPSHFGNSDSVTSAALTATLISILGKGEKDQHKDPGEAWKALEKFAPVVQTLIWALLIFFLAKRFTQPIVEMLRAAGSRLGNVHIKTPFGELFADLHPLSVERQKYNAGQAANIQPPSSSDPVPTATTSGLPEFSQASKSRAGLMRMYYEAEDFVIRTLQQEFGTTIAQNMRTGTGIEMDGFFISQEIPHVIEVKLIGLLNSITALRESITRLIARLREERRFENVQIILVLVTVEELPHIRKRKLEADLAKIDSAVQVRWFEFSELRNRFVE
jgi:hypothetical protein